MQKKISQSKKSSQCLNCNCSCKTSSTLSCCTCFLFEINRFVCNQTLSIDRNKIDFNYRSNFHSSAIVQICEFLFAFFVNKKVVFFCFCLSHLCKWISEQTKKKKKFYEAISRLSCNKDPLKNNPSRI